MELTREIFAKAKETNTVEELVALAKEGGEELKMEQAEQLFARLHQTGELADEELDNVSGGSCSSFGSCPECGCKKVSVKFVEREGRCDQAYCCENCGKFMRWFM